MNIVAGKLHFTAESSWNIELTFFILLTPNFILILFCTFYCIYVLNIYNQHDDKILGIKKLLLYGRVYKLLRVHCF